MFDTKRLNQLTDKYLKFIVENPIDKIDLETAKKIYQDLIDIINYHNYLYYVKAQPVISDYQYDQLYHYLEDLEKKFPQIISPESPTQRLNIPVQEEFKKAKHIVPLLSLENSYNADDIKNWADFVERALMWFRKVLPEDYQNKKISYHIEPKFDGSSVELVYKNWKFVQAITRWDWFIWEDVTENVKTIYNLPMILKGAEHIKELRIRWEVLMPKSAFERLNAERQKQWLPLFANPRNAAAWSLRQLDPKETAKRWLIIYVYELLYIDYIDDIEREFSEEVKTIYRNVDEFWKVLVKNIWNLTKILNKSFFDITQDNIIEWFKKLWLPVFEWEKVAEDIEEVVKICTSEDTLNFFENQEIEFDWLVIKVNELFTWPLLGMTAHHPRWAIAYKFPAKQVATKLLSVEFQVWRTGIITPVANLETVEIGGVKVSRATLHNFDFIKEKDIRVGDRVWVIRSWEVIPYVVWPIKEKRDVKVCISIDDINNIKQKYSNLKELIDLIVKVYNAWVDNFKDDFVLMASKWWKQDIICLSEDLVSEEIKVLVSDEYNRSKVLDSLSQLVKYWALIKILPPNKCPVCWWKVVKFPDEVYFYCSNVNCPAQIKEKLKHFVSKQAMDIAGLGDKLIDLLVDAGLVHHYADIYKLKEPVNKAKLLSLPLMGPKRVEDLLKEIEESKYRPLWRLINALWIRYVGSKTSKLLEEAIFDRLKSKTKDIEELKKLIENFDRRQFIQFLSDRVFVWSIYGIGEKTVESLYKYLNEPHNQEVIKELYEVGVKFNIFEEFEKMLEHQKGEKLPMEGIHFSITGKFPIPRSKLVEILEKYWAVWDEQPKRTTDFILVWQDPGSKLQKAQKYGLKIVDSLDKLIELYPDIKDDIQKALQANRWLF